MSTNPQPKALFNAFIPHLAAHRPDILYDMPEEFEFEECLEMAAGAVGCATPYTWGQLQEVIRKL